MNELFAELQSLRRTRISGTGPLAFPIASIVAHELETFARQGHYDGVAMALGKLGNADDLLAVRSLLADQGVPFDTLFPTTHPETFAALQAILSRSSDAQLSEFTESVTLLEMDAFSRFRS